ncbi:glycoside hydrolase family 15 protein [soil metagenome]
MYGHEEAVALASSCHYQQVGWSVSESTLRYRRDAAGYLPIEAYGAVGNGRTVALIGSDASIDWLCFPRIDGASVFGRILDSQRGGYWQISPVEPWSVQRHYIEDTNVLVTRFETESGIAEIVDFMPSIGFGANLGIVDRLFSGMVIRIVRGVEGRVPIRQVIAPRFDYGRDMPTFELVPGRGALVKGRREYISISCPIPLEREEHALTCEILTQEGEEHHIIASYHGSPAALWIGMEPGTSDRLFGYELLGWRTWISRCEYEGPYSEHVRRSALALKLLDYMPTGAMAAAATTSLPEDLGGVRNWDYRYAWIRDTTYAIYSFMSIGYREEAESFFQWVVDATNLEASSLQIMYSVGGETHLQEQELSHLEGYRGSSPVRIGNAANGQKQLDVWAELLDAAHTYRRFGGAISDTLWNYLASLVNQVLFHWREPDSGIWEVRSEPRRMTYSNVMSWVALDRAVQLGRIDDRPAPYELWERIRDEIYAEVMRFGVDPETGIFTQSFGSKELDAATLSFPLRHFIDANHPVMSKTIDTIARELTVDGLVARYKVSDTGVNSDGLTGDEGHFILTSCWMIDCLIARDQFDQAKACLERLLARSNDLGLYAEQIDPHTGAHLGNFPQAFSHLGIINTIINYARATGQVEAGAHFAADVQHTGAVDD